jgi:hypothetical protein
MPSSERSGIRALIACSSFAARVVGPSARYGLSLRTPVAGSMNSSSLSGYPASAAGPPWICYGSWPFFAAQGVAGWLAGWRRCGSRRVRMSSSGRCYRRDDARPPGTARSWPGGGASRFLPDVPRGVPVRVGAFGARDRCRWTA